MEIVFEDVKCRYGLISIERNQGDVQHTIEISKSHHID